MFPAFQLCNPPPTSRRQLPQPQNRSRFPILNFVDMAVRSPAAVGRQRVAVIGEPLGEEDRSAAVVFFEEEDAPTEEINNNNAFPIRDHPLARKKAILLQPSHPLPLFRVLGGSGEKGLKQWKNYDYMQQVLLGQDVEVSKEIGLSKDLSSGLYVGKFAVRNKNPAKSGLHVAFKVVQSVPQLFNMTPTEGFVLAGEMLEIFLVSVNPISPDDEGGNLLKQICIDSGFLVLALPIIFEAQLNDKRIKAIWKAYGNDRLLPTKSVEKHVVSRIVPEDDSLMDDFSITERAQIGNYLFAKESKFPSPNLGIPKITDSKVEAEIFDAWFPMDHITPEETQTAIERRMETLTATLRAMKENLKSLNHGTRLLYTTLAVIAFAGALPFLPAIFQSVGITSNGVLLEYLQPPVEPVPEMSMWRKILPWNWF